MSEHTPEKVADLIAEARSRTYTPSRPATLIARLADALEATEDARAMTLMFMHHARAERDEALTLIAEAIAYAKALDEWRAFDGRGKHLLAILSRIPEHPKED